jgi:hypothetical protein
MPQHPGVLSALVANLYSLAGLLFFGWSIWTAVAIYWAENMIRIPFVAWRIRRAFPHLSDEEREDYIAARDAEKTNGVPEGRLLREVLARDGLDAAARHAGRRFLLFYGVFALAHGFFVFMLGGLWAPEMDPAGLPASPPSTRWASAWRPHPSWSWSSCCFAWTALPSCRTSPATRPAPSCST